MRKVLDCLLRVSASPTALAPVTLVLFVGITVGFAGPTLAAKLFLDRMFEKANLPLEVAANEPAFPVPNPNPRWIIQIKGTLPATVPLDHFDAEYITDSSQPSVADPICKRNEEHGHYPLRHTERVDLSRDGTRYHASVTADKFAPGNCKWHLFEVTPRLSGNGVEFQPGGVVVRETVPDGTGYTSSADHIDLWCRILPAPNLGKHVCGEFPQYPKSLANLVPAGERVSPMPLVTYPGSSPLTINFHDLNEIVAR
jgi:hypothetical protein